MEKKQWFVVNTYSGHENKVKEKIEMRITSMNMEEYIYRVVVPEQTEVEVKEGVTKEKLKKMFPGYILIEMIMSFEAWHVIRNTPGVTGFLGSSGKGAKPVALSPKEIDRILSNMGMSRLELEKDLKIGDKIKINDGPFKEMEGKVELINLENQRLTVILDLFGQETKVDVDFVQIEKL